VVNAPAFWSAAALRRFYSRNKQTIHLAAAKVRSFRTAPRLFTGGSPEPAPHRPPFQSARGLAHSKTLRAVRESAVNAPAFWSAAALRRFYSRNKQTIHLVAAKVRSFRTAPRLFTGGSPEPAPHRPPFQSARGLAHSKTLRAVRKSPANAPAFWSAAALRRFYSRNKQTIHLAADKVRSFRIAPRLFAGASPEPAPHRPPFQSARGLAHSKTLRAVRELSANASAFWSAAALRRFSLAFP